MAALPNAALAIVEPEKITDYLLSDTHPVGAPKSAFFKGFGFSATRPRELESALLDHAASHAAIPLPTTVHGTKYEVSGALRAPDGRLPRVKTVWIIDTGSSIPRFVTAVPD